MLEETWPLQQEVELDDFDELLSVLLRRGAAHLVYRGQRCYDWPLVCTLSRALREEALAGGPVEHDLMESMVVDKDFNNHVFQVETKLLRVFMEQAKGLGLPDLQSIGLRQRHRQEQQWCPRHASNGVESHT